jgi:hypothetical protein
MERYKKDYKKKRGAPSKKKRPHDSRLLEAANQGL